MSPRLSSEDGEEAPAAFYESDDSTETGVQTACSGEMDLLGEILDTLSTHSSDQGKLAAAKSLDFFRSMDNIDYKAAVSAPPPAPRRECAPRPPRSPSWCLRSYLSSWECLTPNRRCQDFKTMLKLNH